MDVLSHVSSEGGSKHKIHVYKLDRCLHDVDHELGKAGRKRRQRSNRNVTRGAGRGRRRKVAVTSDDGDVADATQRATLQRASRRKKSAAAAAAVTSDDEDFADATPRATSRSTCRRKNVEAGTSEDENVANATPHATSCGEGRVTHRKTAASLVARSSDDEE